MFSSVCVEKGRPRADGGVNLGRGKADRRSVNETGVVRAEALYVHDYFVVGT